MSTKVIRGEYWITNTGEVLEADGDTGDHNHVALALQRAIELIYELAENDPVADALLQRVGRDANYWECDATAFRAELLDTSDAMAREIRHPEYRELYENYEDCLLRAGVTKATMEALWCQDVDPRLWAMNECGWMVVKDDSVVLRRLDDDRVRLIRDGLWDIMMSEGEFEPNTDAELSIIETQTEARYYVTLKVLEDGLVSRLYPLVRKVAEAIPGR